MGIRRSASEYINEKAGMYVFFLLLFLSGAFLAKLWVDSSYGTMFMLHLHHLDPAGTDEVAQERAVSLHKFLQQVQENGNRPCHSLNTSFVYFFGLPEPREGEEITLSTGVLQSFTMVAYDGNGTRRCHGGDFYEADLSGTRWKSRPRVGDAGDGSYVVEMLVDDAFPGIYTFNATLLFSNFHGLDHRPGPWLIQREVLNFKISFVSRGLQSRYLPSCLKDDFSLRTWWGRWTRTKFNDTCVRPSGDTKRYQCLSDDEQCDLPWCDGPLGKLDSNGWVYSAHCRFHIWSRNEAWECLKSKRLFFWGDSNHQDTIRNLLNLVLGLNYTVIDRFANITAVDPGNPSRAFNLLSLFNGHHEIDKNEMGLKSLNVDWYRSKIANLYQEGGFADIVVINSGLHDGWSFVSPQEYIAGARNASKMWGDLLRESPKKTRVVFRTTVAPAGIARKFPSNPNKNEVFNWVLMEELGKEIEGLRMVDAYDMTFPWHYDNAYSDGGHYGRMPFLYFADVMVVHALLNSICS